MNGRSCGKFVPRCENQMQRPAEKDEPTGSPGFVLILNFLISSRPLSTASKRSALPIGNHRSSPLSSYRFIHPRFRLFEGLSKEAGPEKKQGDRV